ncbi:hypothetical protein K461DRAFT_278026 [Myriangium duriaei CBS 260.36]|uniref:Uncharacterized protein n=1 Tax=Myriangium duriaei CBS 260.36 TaxID=1168546 RepID=A0A9P4J4B9_9PEZI|nr:hypothetical protein K461DRAFT_278026 [Myriangium duriaei CBS 260.36]
MRISLLLLWLLPTSALDLCQYSDPVLPHANVTNGYSIPGFLPNADGQTIVSNATFDVWNITAAVYRNATTLQTDLRTYLSIPATQLQQYDFRNHTTKENATQWNSSPIICAQVMEYSLATLPLSRSSPDGRCTSLASVQCLADLEQQFLQPALQFRRNLGSAAPQDPTTFCQEYRSSIPNATKWPDRCASLSKEYPRGNYGSSGFDLSNLDAKCPLTLPAYGGDPLPTSPDDYTVYDRAVNGITTWIFTRFGNASMNDSGADVQIMCPSAGGEGNHTSPGSRNVVIPDATAAGRDAGPSAGQCGVGAMKGAHPFRGQSPIMDDHDCR